MQQTNSGIITDPVVIAAMSEKLRSGTRKSLTSNNPAITPAIAAVSLYANALFEPDDLIEVRRLSSKPGGPVESSWHRASQLPEQVQILFTKNQLNKQNIYVGVNPRSSANVRGDAGVKLARTVFCDFDLTTVGQAREKIEQAGLPVPTFTVNSGHGVHCYWRLVKPMIDLAAWSEFQKDLAALLDSDPKVCNPERIMRLPGFRNLKPPQADCVIVEFKPSRRYPLAELQAVIPSRPIAAPVADAAGALPNVAKSERLSRCRAYVAKMPDSVDGQNGSDALLQVACECFRFGLSEESATLILNDYNTTRCKPMWSDKELAHKLIDARKKVGDDFACRLREDGEKDRPTQSQQLVSLADDAEFFHDNDAAYATVTVGDHRENHAVNGKSFKLWLSERFYRQHKKAAGGQAIQDALGVIAGRALFDGTQQTVAVRVGQHDGEIYLDLCNPSWQAVRVTKDGWSVVDSPPIKFIRRRGMLPLPTPVHEGSLDDLRPLINAGDDPTWRLIVSWLIMTLHPRGPYPILAVNGEQGSAKSTLCKMLRGIVDPNEAVLRSAPRDDRDLMIAAVNSLVMAFDNLSAVPPQLSDALCRLATGGGFSTRELFTDGEEKLFDAARPILFNGIEELANRPDLLERSIVVNLPTIGEASRRSEVDLWQAYNAAKPRILGALLTAVSTAIRNLPTVKLDRRPRMADFAEWIVAAEPALPWPTGAFLADYEGNRETANELALEASAVGPAVIALMAEQRRWQGSAGQLLAALEKDWRTPHRQDWPRTPKGLANSLRRLAPALRRMGIDINFDRAAGGNRERIIRLEQTGL
jgi:hypothetical protein